MSEGLGSDKGKGIAYDLNFKPVDEDEVPLEQCSICFEPLGYEKNDRTVVKLSCHHKFHLDCIGSAYNAKGKMQCPNCRNVEPGEWLYANGPPIPNPIEDMMDMMDEEEEHVQELPPFGSGPFPNLDPPTMPTGSLPASLYNGTPVLPSGPRPFRGNIVANSPWLGQYGPRHFVGNEPATNSLLPYQFDGFNSFDDLRRDIARENLTLRNRIAQNLALLAEIERNSPLMRSFDGAESSRTGAMRGGRGGSSYGVGGSSNDEGGICICGGSGNGGGCMYCGRRD
ncbi:hypothetical protein AALP_AA8G461000 [Arabis alpina]|uniref:RING-type domain-containing protein n=1 Tax=Arabis alpina TaxID=50452 RepID=A0A087GDR8_ARAAL|nr:hypothetical protein AALP_AA8G461000 [Arabis alpina]